MKLDIEKWNKVRKELEAQIKATKHSIRRVPKPIMQYKYDPATNRSTLEDTGKTYVGGSYEEYNSLGNMKWDATTLYAVRAACRNKQHCEEWTKEDAIDKILPQYALLAQEEKPQ